MKKYDVRDDKGNHYTITEQEEKLDLPTISDIAEEGRYCLDNFGVISKGRAVFLCLFFGIFGVHKFYERKIGMGILYLLTGGLCYIGVLVDLIVLLGYEGEYYNPNDTPSIRHIFSTIGKALGIIALFSIIPITIALLVLPHLAKA